MRRLGRHMGWLGWAVAGVLALSAGGVALAATSQTTSTTQTTVAGAAGKGGGGLGGRLGWRVARRALHGEATFQTRDGVKTVVFARGKVTAVSGSSVTITSSDNVATTFALNADTRYGAGRRQQQAKSDLKVGVQAVVAGLSSGSATATRVVVRTGAERAPKGP